MKIFVTGKRAVGRKTAAAARRMTDIVASALLLAVLSPLLLAIAVIVRLRLGAPVIFRQVRPGLRAEPFTILKFRTMRDAVGHTGQPLPDEERLTPFGQRLRRTSLDELPELMNVLKGDMSLVGPRPLIMEYVPLYSKTQSRRHLVKPGITGLAQVSGRNAISWDEKFELDVYYVDHQTLWLDLRILVRTVRRVFDRSGISTEGYATSPPFVGSAVHGDPRSA
jgi:lipopolysaccharide/colanic/teichoic acid biosynthesis glycosyltransferase